MEKTAKNTGLILQNIILALIYWGLSYTNYLLLKEIGLLPMPIWPAAGIAFAAAYYYGLKITPGLALGAFLANYLTLGSSWEFALGISVMNSLAPQLTAWMMHRIIEVQKPLKTYYIVLLCFCLALIITPLLTALGGIGTKYLLGLVDAANFAPDFFKWTLAHSIGTIIFASPIFIYLFSLPQNYSKHTPSLPESSGLKYIPLENAILLSIYFWVADSFFGILWFPVEGYTLRDYFLPLNDIHEVCMRTFVILAFMLSGIAVSKIIDILLNQQQDALNTANNLRTTLNAIGDGVISTDINRIITRINPVACTITGWEAGEAIGQDINQVLTLKTEDEREHLPNPVQKVIETKETQRLKRGSSLISRLEKKYLVSISASPITSDSRLLKGVVLVLKDITEEIEIERRLKHSQRMEAIGQLAGGVAHDFNNMLGGIIGFSELLAKNVAGDEESVGYVNMIIDTSEKAATLTRKLLAFARKTNVPFSNANIHTIIRDSVELLKRSIDKRLEIYTELTASRHGVYGSPSQLQNIFINLGINAANAISNEGKLIITSRDVNLDSEYCRRVHPELNSGDFIEIKVTDTGCGIPARNLENIFEPFFTTNKDGKGTGLGLSAVYGTIQQHKGSISVSSIEGAGTTFTLLLPASEYETSQKEEDEEEVSPSQGHILIIDDEYIMRVTAARILEEAGFCASIADGGREGLRLFRQHPERFQLVILDMIMPEMNGRDCFKELQKIDPEVQVILASGFTEDEIINEMLSDGLFSFISKPYRSKELLQIVREAINSQ